MDTTKFKKIKKLNAQEQVMRRSRSRIHLPRRAEKEGLLRSLIEFPGEIRDQQRDDQMTETTEALA